MTPWEHELSQMLGKAMSIADLGGLASVEKVLTAARATVEILDREIAAALDSPIDEKIERDIENRLWEWSRENEWLFYELTEAGWAA